MARAVETCRGARVEDYAPLFALLEKHTFPALRRAFVETRSVGETSVAALAAAARRLCLSLVDAHNVVAGASLGPESVRRAAPSWSAAVTHASASSAFAFLGALNDRSRDGSEAAKAALSALLPAAAPALVALVEGGRLGDRGLRRRRRRRRRRGRRRDTSRRRVRRVVLGSGLESIVV